MRRIVKFCPPGNPLWQILTWNRLILWVTDIGVQKDHLQQTNFDCATKQARSVILKMDEHLQSICFFSIQMA